ncbi:ParA family protein [Phyllobacterium brassicacearum]|uniref:ParA family protein n=1 Tax=Phyllobacterium brassicacearum TaxID=314235 RepID=A0A2P7B5H7_9HYPH|nr:ParA family protein [Phyllobacterium brassicacearum]PSH61718.1 ParA family protein [Phyllobacterium brassicacearum]TDQ15328.1 chromosome partitioning protein [Phyllobacterium brassicacearum]
MTVITFANSKGGVGKSTLCLLIGSELAMHGSNVLILDADAQKSCFKWAERCQKAGTLPSNLKVEPAATIEQLTARLGNPGNAEIVLVDVQGSMNDLLTAAIVASSLTLVPSKATVMEMVEAVQLFEWSKNLRRAPLRLVLNGVEGIDLKTVAFQDAITLIRGSRIPCLGNFVRSRKLYQQFSKDAGTLAQISDDPAKQDQVEKARKNIRDLIEDIVKAIAEENSDPARSA